MYILLNMTDITKIKPYGGTRLFDDTDECIVEGEGFSPIEKMEILASNIKKDFNDVMSALPSFNTAFRESGAVLVPAIIYIN